MNEKMTTKKDFETSLHLEFETKGDGNLLTLASENSAEKLQLAISQGHLVLAVSNADVSRTLDAEDADRLADGQTHYVAVVRKTTGTQLYLDGYEVFSSTSTLKLPSGPGLIEEAGALGSPTVRGVEYFERALTSEEILAKAKSPSPFVEFAAARLSARDAKRIRTIKEGSLRARFRVRGIHQGGTIFNARSTNSDLTLAIQEGNITYRVIENGEEAINLKAFGHWDDGNWHEVVLTSGYGQTLIYVDGYQVARAPGVCFLADLGEVTGASVGMDLDGLRLFGEAHVAMIFDFVLSDRQVKKFQGVKPVETIALFDSGYKDSISYRIPSLLTTKSGVIIAGADQRTSIANDSPNHINFVIRRSLDGGETWEELQTIIESVGAGASGASVIDSLLVQDQESGRIIALLDHFPGGIGQPNSAVGTGYDESSRMILSSADGQTYYAKPGESVVDSNSKATEYELTQSLDLLKEGKTLGNVDLVAGHKNAPPLLSARTSYLWMIYSDDDGASWSKPKDITNQVKLPWMRFFGTSPGTGIQIKSGQYAGRIVMPVYYNHEEGITFSCAAIYSDDQGETWQLGKSPNDGRIFDGVEINSRDLSNDLASLHESVIVETSKDELTVFMRNQHSSGKVAKARSIDGGESWQEIEYDEQLTEIFSQPNAISVNLGEETAVVFANASDMLPFRGCGVLRMSLDGARTWAHNRVFNPRHYVYQSMAQLPDGRLALLWEREWHGLYLSYLDLEWLTQSKHTIS